MENNIMWKSDEGRQKDWKIEFILRENFGEEWEVEGKQVEAWEQERWQEEG